MVKSKSIKNNVSALAKAKGKAVPKHSGPPRLDDDGFRETKKDMGYVG